MKCTNLDEELDVAIKETRIIAKIIELDSTCLMCFQSDTRVIEGHHVGGKNNSEFIVPLCANCHVLATKNQLNYPQNWAKPRLNSHKTLYVLQDLQFLQQRITQLLVDDDG